MRREYNLAQNFITSTEQNAAQTIQQGEEQNKLPKKLIWSVCAL